MFFLSSEGLMTTDIWLSLLFKSLSFSVQINFKTIVLDIKQIFISILDIE